MSDIIIVTVTYGKRAHLLVHALESAFREGADKAIVVNNGSHDDIAAILNQKFPERVKIVQMDRNTGSARGFAEGLRTAYNDGAEFILLLDDDNVLEKKALDVLMQGWQSNSNGNNNADLIMLGFRPEHYSDVAEGLTTNRINQHPDSFFGFQIVDIPFKLWRRTAWFRRQSAIKTLQTEVPITAAPYSGMFFHKTLLEKHGYPNHNFVLYGDDLEFTYRVTCNGGKIRILTEALMSDLETSWFAKKRFNSIFEVLLLGNGDFKVYYSIRNQAYYEAYCRNHNKRIRSINRMIFLFILKIYALKYAKSTRLKLLRNAISDGESALLGVNANYPLT
jgi:glycosyltransferase involved in cell wall biosynthesis